MGQIPTAKEFIFIWRKKYGKPMTGKNLEECLKAFTAMHTQLCLEAASDQARIAIQRTTDGKVENLLAKEDYICSFTECKAFSISEESIMKAYPVENIK